MYSNTACIFMYSVLKQANIVRTVNINIYHSLDTTFLLCLWPLALPVVVRDYYWHFESKFQFYLQRSFDYLETVGLFTTFLVSSDFLLQIHRNYIVSTMKKRNYAQN